MGGHLLNSDDITFQQLPGRITQSHDHQSHDSHMFNRWMVHDETHNSHMTVTWLLSGQSMMHIDEAHDSHMTHNAGVGPCLCMHATVFLSGSTEGGGRAGARTAHVGSGLDHDEISSPHKCYTLAVCVCVSVRARARVCV